MFGVKLRGSLLNLFSASGVAFFITCNLLYFATPNVTKYQVPFVMIKSCVVYIKLGVFYIKSLVFCIKSFVIYVNSFAFVVICCVSLINCRMIDAK